MRALRTSLAVASLLGFVPALAFGQIKPLLEFRPVVKGAMVDYDVPADAKAIDSYKLEVSKKPGAYILRDGQGKLLRRFVDNDMNKKLDQWSYFQDGFEVYREVDLDGDSMVDEARWMNGGGTRTAVVKKNTIVGWKRISAEEASKVLVQAIAVRDLDLLATVMARPEELAALGVPEGEVQRVGQAMAGRPQAIEGLWKTLVGWTEGTAWLRLDAAMPHVIPADAGPGLKGDLTLYENAVIFAGPANGGAPDKTAFLQATELVKVGEAWKFVDLPRAINPAKNDPMVAIQGGVRSAIFADAAAPAEKPALALAIKNLADFDNANADKMNSPDKQVVAAAYVQRIPFVREVVKACDKPDETLAYNRQIVDCLANAYQTGKYPAGLKLLNVLEAEGGKVGSYASYRRLNADYSKDSENADVNVVAVQKKWMNDMKEFIAKYGQADEAPDVLFQLASNSEFNGEDKDANDFYNQLVSAFPQTIPGRKAAGALLRHALAGKPIVLQGKGVDGQTVDLAKYRGKTVLVAFWATWSPQVKRDMAEIVKIYDKNRAKGFEVVGIWLDNDQAALQAALQDVPKTWAQVFEPGALESRFAIEYGIMSVPTMFLVDPDGKVINPNIRSSADLDIQLDKALAGKPGVAFGAKQ